MDGEVIWEITPGYTSALDEWVEATGGWVCEQHPQLEWPHDDCAGPGMPRHDAVEQGLV